MYRLAVFAAMLAVLAIAVSTPQALSGGPGSVRFAAGYVVIRLILIALYLRAYRHEPRARALGGRYVAGITIIVLGGTVILAVTGLDVEPRFTQGNVAAIGFLIAVALWWSYFTFANDAALDSGAPDWRSHLYGLCWPRLAGGMAGWRWRRSAPACRRPRSRLAVLVAQVAGAAFGARSAESGVERSSAPVE